MTRGGERRHGYALIHFVEDPDGHAEKVFLSRSVGDNPQRWERLNGGRPILESTIGTTGVRDPYLVRTDHGFTVIATDLRVWGGDGKGWDQWTRHGSRSLLIWDSPDLLRWSEPRLVEVAPPAAGMAWAPEAIRDPKTGDFLVFWSSTLFDEDDPGHCGDSYSRILVSRTRDFHHFSPASVLVDVGKAVIDMTAVQVNGRTHRFLKEDSERDGFRKLYHEIGSEFFADDFDVVAERIGDDLYSAVEAPLIFGDNNRDRWYLFIDQYETRPQGYLGLWTDNLESGEWTAFTDEEFSMPANTKHGAVLPLTLEEWTRLGELDIQLGATPPLRPGSRVEATLDLATG